VVSTIVEDRNTTINGTTTHYQSTRVIVDAQSTATPVTSAVETPVLNSTVEPEPHFVVNIITDSTPLPTGEPSLPSALPTARPTSLPSIAPTKGPTYPKGTYVVNVDVSGLPPRHGAVEVPVAMPDGQTTVVEVPPSE
jgi:hypothetical protein